MWVSKAVSKVWLLVSMITALWYQMTGANSMKAVSVFFGIAAISMLVPYLSDAKHFSRSREILSHLRFLK